MATDPLSFLTPEELVLLQGPPPAGLLGQAAPDAPAYIPDPHQFDAYIQQPPQDAPVDPLAPLPDGASDGYTPDTSQPYYPDTSQGTATPKVSEDQPLVIHPKEPLPAVVRAKPLNPELQSDQPIVIVPKGKLPTADLGSIAQSNTATNERAASQANILVPGSDKAVFLQRMSDEINSSAHWKDTPEQMAALAKQVAKDVGDETLADQVPFNFSQIALYRSKPGGTSPSPVGWQTAGAVTGQTAEDKQREIGVPGLVENTSTTRMKAGFREGNYAALQAAEEILGIDDKHADARRKYYSAVQELAGPGIQPTQVRSFRDALTMAAQQAVEQEPYLATSIAGGELGAVLKGSVGAALGAFGTSYGMELGQVEENTKEINPNAKAGWRTAIAAGGAAALDSIVPAGIGKALVARVGQEAADRAAWQMLFAPAESKLGQALTVLKGMAKTAGIEGTTEAAQQLIEAAGGSWEATGKVTLPDDILDQMANAGVGGAILGGGSHVAAHSAEAQAHGENMIGEMDGAQFATPADQLATTRTSPSQGTVPNVPAGPNAPLVLSTTVPVKATTVPTSTTGEPQTPLIPKGVITSRFGPRHAFMTDSGHMSSSNHAGNDIVIPGGKKADIPAAVDGVVVFAGQKGGYGNYVTIKASDGTTFSYGHLSRIGVKVGDQVSQGQALGKQGATGNATGVHVHFERRDAQGRVVDSLTGRQVKTEVATNDKGEQVVVDNTPHRVNQNPYTEEETSPFPLDEANANYEAATGRSIANEEGPDSASSIGTSEPSAVSDLGGHLQSSGVPNPEDQPAVLGRPHPGATIEQDTTTIGSRPIDVIANRVLHESPLANVDATAESAARRLSATQANNVAAQALHEIEVSKNQGANDFSQPLQGEEPVFDETQSQVVAFHNPETGSVRAIGEPPEDFGGGLPANAGLLPTPETGQSSIPNIAPADAATTEQIPAVQEPTVPAQQPLGIQPIEDRIAQREQMPPEQPALPVEPQAQPVPETTPEAPQTPAESVPASEATGEAQPTVVAPEAFNEAPTPLAHIDRMVSKIDDKLFDLENDGTKAQAMAYAKRLVKDGVLDPAEVDSLAHIAKDRDMGVEDITSEIRTSVDIWHDKQRVSVGKARVVDTRYGPIAEPAPDDHSFSARIARQRIEEARNAAEQGRPEATQRRGEEGPALERPPVEADGTIVLDHYSVEEKLGSTDPQFFGKNIKVFSPQERAYLRDAPPRTYFGIAAGQNGGYKNEFTGRTHFQARIPAERLYDVGTDPDNLWVRGQPAQSEWNIKNAGYSGYWHNNPELGLVAIVFDAQQVTKVAAPSRPQQAATSREIGQQREQVRQDAKAYKQAVLDKVHAIYKDMGLEGLVPVEVVNKLFGPTGEEYRGVFDPDMVIRISAFAQGNPVTDFELRGVARHEVVHWAVENRVWTSTEWKLLKNWAASQPDLMAWARENYPKPEWTEEDILEEAVAEGFSRWDNGRLQAVHNEPSSLIQKLFQKLKDLATNLRLAFTNAGVTAGELRQAQKLLADFENGKHIARLKQANRPTFGRNVRKDSLSYELLTRSITPDQHWFLSRMKGGKFQSAWHGSPKENIDKFSLEYIGTGEGAQAFGWGLYFAQKKDVADWYRRKLTMDTKDPVDIIMEVNGRPIREWIGERLGKDFSIAQYEVADRLFDYLSTNKPYNGWLDALHARFDNDLAEHLAAAKKEGNMVDYNQLLKDGEDVGRVFVALSGQKITQKQYPMGGKTYKVEVPENEDLLDLDKPIKDQSPKVLAAAKKIISQMKEVGNTKDFESVFGPFEEFYSNASGYELQRTMKMLANNGRIPENASEELQNATDGGHGAMAASIWLRDNGIPGSRYLDRDSRVGQGDTANFVIFDDDYITLRGKYRVVDGTPANSPLSDPSKPDPGMIQKIHDNTMGMLTSVASLGNADWDRSDNILDAWRRKMTNKYQQIIKTQRRAEKLLGVDRMDPDANPMDQITADERGYKLNVVTDNMIKPMLQELHNRGLTIADLGAYLYARHAPHRNARIAKINKEFNTTDKPGSGMSNDEAAKIMADYAAQGKLTDLANAAQHIDNMIEYAQQERLNAGLLTTADIAAGFQPGEFYVPLRGHSEAEPEFEIDMPFAGKGRGGGFSVSGKEGRRMFGRHSQADMEEIVGYSITQAQDAIDRAFRNRVAQSMANMFRAVPDPNFVKIDRVKRVAVWNKKLGKVEYQMQTRITDPEEIQRTVYYKEDGVVHKMTFNEHNMSALRFVKAAKNLGVADVGRGLRFMSLYTRFFTKANTQWNLDFVLANAAKDIQTAVVNASTLDVKGLRRAIVRNVLSMGPIRGAWWGVHNPAGHGFGQTQLWRNVYAEFEANGGKLDYGQTAPVEKAIRDAKAEIKNLSRNPMNPIKAVKAVGGWIDKASSAFENQTRLAAYKALRDAGIPPKRAAVAVRELTTNFQQHGEWGPKINAAYGFANATVIGGARFTTTVVKKPQIAAAIIGVGMLADWLNALWDPDRWDRYDESVKDRDFMVLLPQWMGFDIHIPAGYGINTLATVGRKMSELWRDKKNADGSKESVLDAAGAVFNSAVNAFSPVPGHSFLNILAPSALDPFVDLFQDEDNWGHSIYPKGSDRPGYIKPNSQLVRDQTSAFWRGLAEGLNQLGGGDDVQPGLAILDHSPESYKYVAEQIGGGAVRTVGRVVGLAEDAFTGEKPALNDIPVVRRFAGRPYGAAGAADEEVSVFYDNFNTAQETLGTAKRMMERYGKHSPEYAEWAKDHEPVLAFHKNIEAAEKRVNTYTSAASDLRRARDASEGLDKDHRHAIFKATGIPVPRRQLTDEEFKRQMDALNLRRAALAERFNEDWRKRVMGEVE